MAAGDSRCRITSMKASRAAQGLGKDSRPRVLKRWSSSAFSESSASRSGRATSDASRTAFCSRNPIAIGRYHAQLQELFSWISTSHSAG